MLRAISGCAVVLLFSCGQGGRVPTTAAGDAGGADAVADYPDPRTALCARYGATDAATSVSFDVVQRIFDDNCTSCHANGAPLDLSEGVAFDNIVGHPVPSVESCGGTLVARGNSAASYIYQKLTNGHPCAGAQMPIDEFFQSSPLPDCVTNIIRTWIDEGAPAVADGGGPGG